MTTKQDSSPSVESAFVPKDDESVAKYLADHYRAVGVDPSAAYDRPDDAIEDFGGIDAFR